MEVKAGTKVTALQQMNLDLIARAGGTAFVIRIEENYDAKQIAVALQPLIDFLEAP